jgi:putative nucleotidyltransferase with HDIG domain
MAFDPTVEEQLHLAATFEQGGTKMAARERLTESVVGAAFLVTMAVLIWRLPPHALSVPLALACLVVLALAAMVRFDTPFGFTVATQVAFVPALFALPLSVVPPVVVISFLLAHAPQIRRGRFRPDRLLLAISNGWFSVGPVLVFALSGTSPRRAGVPLLLAALAAQIALDAVISSIRLWGARRADVRTQLHDAWVYAVDAALAVIGLMIAEDVHNTRAAVLAPLPLLWLLSMFARERHNRLTSLVALNNAYRGTALVLGDVIEADDGYTGEHCRSVVSLALTVAEALGLNLEQQRDLEFGALLHDVGKIAIPKEIINKPGALNAQEWTVIKTHTIEGQRLLDRVGGFMREVGLIVRSHHERWDGSGYPDGLAGEEIPIEARIIACCDTWNAMRTDRAYRKALDFEVALTELRGSAGAQLDPDVVRVLTAIVEAEHEALNGSERPLPAARGIVAAALPGID